MNADTIHFGFLPDPGRAMALDRRMHVELGGSLRHIVEQSRGHVAFDEAGMARMIAGLEAGQRVPPQVFSDYYLLAQALLNDELDDAALLFDRIGRVAPGGELPLHVTSLGDETLGADTERFMAMMNADPSLDIGFAIPNPDVASAFRDRLSKGLALMDKALPDLAGEIRNIIRLVVISGSDPARTMQFDGGSHYQLWGAVFLNGSFHPTPVAVAEVLAHECAHSLLFAFCMDEALTANPEHERFKSPLRVDPRPMEGIYHATFVSARMHWAMSQLARSDLLTDEERADAQKAADADLKNFLAGHEVIATQGQLTETGRRLMAEAKAYIDTVH